MDCLEPLDFDEQEVDADAFFGEIAARLAAHFRQAGTPVSIHVDAQIVDIPLSLAEDLGRIAEVLLNNACTHGRNADGSVTAWLSFHIHRKLIHLTVEDYGPGLPQDFDLEAQQSNGFRRVSAILDGCNGVVRWSNQDGARITICVPHAAPQDDHQVPSITRDDLHTRRIAKQRGR